MIPEFIRTHKIISIITVIIIGFIIFGSYVYISRIGKEPVAIYLVPSDAALTVNGKKYRPGTAYIEPGTYTVQASHEGFEDYEATVTISQPNTADIDIALVPMSEEAQRWKEENLDLYLAREGRIGAQANEFGIAFEQQHPITEFLPYRSKVYTIGYRLDPEDSSDIILEINTITGLRNAAIEQIRTLGYEPTDYKINFNSYENPFDNE